MTILDVRRLMGVSFSEIKMGMAKAETDDPLLGACYMLAASRAVYIHRDRHGYNLREAEALREDVLRKAGGEEGGEPSSPGGVGG